MKTPCWNCQGRAVLMFDCDTCEGTGVIDEPRLHVMSRRKRYIGLGQRDTDKHGNEKWARLTVEVPPEIAAELDRIAATTWRGHTVKRSSIVLAALLHWMEDRDPEPDAHVDATAEEVIERLEIGEASVVEEDQ